MMVFNWFSDKDPKNRFDRVHDFRTLKYMTHMCETDIMEDDKKEKYIEFIDYTDAIAKEAKKVRGAKGADQ